jgi:hypothetical protein
MAGDDTFYRYVTGRLAEHREALAAPVCKHRKRSD